MYGSKAPVGARIGAFFLDSLFLSLIISVATFISSGLGAIVSLLGAFLYFGLCEGSKLQASPGKYLCGLAVVDERGIPLQYGQAFLRSLCRLLSGVVVGIGFLIGLFQPQGRTLHDQLAHTVVIKRAKAPEQPVVINGYRPTTSPGVPAHPKLLCVAGPLAGRVFPIDTYGLVIGRDSTVCSVVIPAQHSEVSRQHCRLVYDRNQHVVWLYDVNSTRGTYLGSGIRVQPNAPVMLHTGDEFWLASPNFRFRLLQ